MADDSAEQLDFEMLDVPGLAPEEARRRKRLRDDASRAAAQRYMAAQANGADPEEAKRAAARGAARVKSLDMASRKVDGAMADLDHLGADHPAIVLLTHALELIEREQLLLVGRRAQAS